MKSTILAALAGFGALAAAQSLSSLPKCAQSCVGNSFGGCGPLDVKCICSNTNLISELSCCVATKCPPADQQTTIQFASQLCAADGVTLPTSASCASSSTSTASSSSSGATGGAAAPASTSVSGSSMASSMMSSMSTTSSTMSGSSSMTGSMASTSAVATTTGSSSATKASQASSASGSSAAAASPSTGGGSHLLGSNMGAAGAAIAALVLL